MQNNLEDDSNAAFGAFDSDSNQTGTFDGIDYNGEKTPSKGSRQTDFSALVMEERQQQQEENSSRRLNSTPTGRKTSKQ